VDIVRIHQGRELPLLSGTAQHQPLCAWEAFPLPPQRGLEGDGAEGLLDFPLRGPAGGAVLAVTHSFTLDAVQAAPAGKGGNGDQGAEYHRQQEDQHPGVVVHCNHPFVVCSLRFNLLPV